MAETSHGLRVVEMWNARGQGHESFDTKLTPHRRFTVFVTIALTCSVAYVAHQFFSPGSGLWHTHGRSFS
jgi:hypothetical protein